MGSEEREICDAEPRDRVSRGGRVIKQKPGRPDRPGLVGQCWLMRPKWDSYGHGQAC